MLRRDISLAPDCFHGWRHSYRGESADMYAALLPADCGLDGSRGDARTQAAL
jgi:hypothetical protein